MQFLCNPWVVGIVGGILSGIIVTFITRAIFSKKDNGIYLQNLRLANNEVIYALRPAISENQFPTLEVINALIEANSRKFKVNKNDMYNIKQIAEELTKEIMDTSFIAYEKKEQLFKHLTKLYKTENAPVLNIMIENKEEIQEYKKRLLNRVTILLGIMATLFTIVITFYIQSNNIINNHINNKFTQGFTMVVSLTAVIAIVSALMGTLLLRIQKLSLKKESEKAIKKSGEI